MWLHRPAGFAADQEVEDGQNALAEIVEALQLGGRGRLRIVAALPAGHQAGGEVDVLAELVGGMAAHEEAEKEGRFFLRAGQFPLVPHLRDGGGLLYSTALKLPDD